MIHSNLAVCIENNNFIHCLQVESVNDMSKIPRLPGDGAQADPDLNVVEVIPKKKKSVTHTIHESRKSIHEMECGEINGRIVCIRKHNILIAFFV